MSRPPVAATRVWTAGEHEAQLWVSDIQTVRERDTSYFDAIVTVCQENVCDHVEDEIAYSYFNMSDGETGYGGDASYELFERSADLVQAQLRDGKDTLVHCHVGRSRSVSVCAAVIAIVADVGVGGHAGARIGAAYDLIRMNRDIDPKPTLRGHAIRYVEENA